MPLGEWIRQQAFANMESRLPEPTLEGGVPAPLFGETATDYRQRLDSWSLAATNDRDMRSRFALATTALVQYSSTR
jgi:hypothetical protein